MTQNAQILEYLKTGAVLTPKDALNMFGSLRLGARIYDLRAAGHNISKRIIEVPGKNGSVAHVAEYRLLSPESEEATA